VALLLLGGAAFGARWLMVSRYLESTDDAYLQADAVTVSPKVSGYIADVLVADNQQVRAGQAVARLDDKLFRAELDQAEADVQSATSELAGMDTQIEQQQARLAQAEAQLASAKAQSDYAQEESARYRQLIGSGAVSAQRAAETEMTLKQSAAAQAEARARLDAEKRQSDMARTGRDKAAAALARASAMREQARLRESYTEVAATVDGVVGDRALRVGQYVQAGTRLMTVVPVADTYLVANFKETQVERIFRGETVRIALDAYPDLEIDGVVDSLAPGTGAQFALLPAENATGSFTKIVQRVPVKIRISRDTLSGAQIRPGLSATATVDTRTMPSGPALTLVPAER
jgi:membrane fusion protein (multidrug efflux system)